MIELLSLGGGVQSTCVLLMSLEGDLPPLDYAVFSDTGWEPRAVYDHLDWLTQHAAGKGLKIDRVHKSNIKEDAMVSQVRGKAEDGKRWASLPYYVKQSADSIRQEIAERELQGLPVDKLKKRLKSSGKGMIRRQCTKEYKIEPINRWIKSHVLGLKRRKRWPREPVIRQWFGISLDEWQRMRSSNAKWRTHFYPLVDRRMTRLMCLEWLEDHGYPRPPRSACIGCPFHSDLEWRNMKLHHPEEFEDACSFDDAIRHMAGMRGQCFLHRSCRPLREINFSIDLDHGQQAMFPVLQCEHGMCGV